MMNGPPTLSSTDDAIAKHLFERIARMGNIDLPSLNVWNKPLGNFNGDIILCALRPCGGIYILLADFTVHGLSTAVVALPVAEVFYDMTVKCLCLSEIIEEINKKLLFVLPEGMHGSVCLMELDGDKELLTVWNGGMPDVLVLDAELNIKHRVSSLNIPLGLGETKTSDLDMVFIDLSANDTLFWCSDGAVNAEDSQGEKFGQDKIERFLMQDKSLSTISNAITKHTSEVEPFDDITLAKLDISALRKDGVTARTSSTLTKIPPAKWEVDFTFSAAVLRELDLVPLLVNVIMEVQAPHEHRQRIYIVLAEMFSNTLEHGLLCLDSSMKVSAEGFAEYYTLRGQRLQKLEDAYIKIMLQHEPTKAGGRLTISFEDSGDGFDYQQRAKDLATNTTFCGRGEGIIRQLCSDYYYSGIGNCSHAVYNWSI
jgi:hypothetical protein